MNGNSFREIFEVREAQGIFRPYVIAEVGVNHEGSLELAKRQIREAAAAKADGVKFQTYKASKLACKESPSYWDLSEETTTSQHQLFSRYDCFETQDYIELAKCCAEHNVDFLSTPFDLEAVTELSPYVPFFKISSSDITNIPLIREVAATQKPVVLSTGASFINEIRLAVAELHDFGCRDVLLMHCVLNYPTESSSANLDAIKTLQSEFSDCIIGYSDHTRADNNLAALLVASSLGAKMLEKHFTHDKLLPGNDHYHSMDANDLKKLILDLDLVLELRGSGRLDESARSGESAARLNARRSIVASQDLKAGQTLAPEHLICKRPATGVSPTCWDNVVGATLLRDVDEDQPITVQDLGW